jgi:hypothetical protein
MRKVMAGLLAAAAAAAVGTVGMQGAALAEGSPTGSPGTDAGSDAEMQITDLVQQFVTPKNKNNASNASIPGKSY